MAGDDLPQGYVRQRRAHHAARAGDVRDVMARGAAVLLHELFAMCGVAAGLLGDLRILVALARGEEQQQEGDAFHGCSFRSDSERVSATRRSASPSHAAKSATPTMVKSTPAGIHMMMPASCWSSIGSMPHGA